MVQPEEIYVELTEKPCHGGGRKKTKIKKQQHLLLAKGGVSVDFLSDSRRKQDATWGIFNFTAIIFKTF